MTRKLFLLSMLLCLVCPSEAQAVRFTGTYLLHVCSSDEDGSELTEGGHVACQAYISGILDYHNIIRALGTAPSVDFCVPEGTTLNDLQKIVARYLMNNAEAHSSFVAAPAVALALYEAYPCDRE